MQLDSTFNLDVPPDRPALAVSASVDFWQPGGIYRDVRLRVVPQAFLADVFAKPVNVLDAAARQVVVEVTVDAAVAPPGACRSRPRCSTARARSPPARPRWRSPGRARPRRP